ncbi:MAG: DUF971 domain-containing protein [Pseudomonadota bacterium]
MERQPKVTELRLSKDKRMLTVSFDTGETFEISAELLRVESPSAEVQGHDPSQKKIIPGKENVEIINIEPLGNYAVRVSFDDMHNTGIYSWSVLHRLGVNQGELMVRYREAVASQS